MDRTFLQLAAIADPSDYSNEDFKEKGLVIRRFKDDVRDQLPTDTRTDGA